ncbi:polysaccharide deacetylase family protein [Spirosoma rhododendri]|uniref:Polysaccharide deacetylase family protein n=1 Tax=Spirosoma rhododendri TaxID=2728024 RepID=A0A7L5DPQ1_9BACT|nr:polysaccharide deacetylase family protein [Spirosoma rhododendri]QJD77690.1 polysaccharide deacetylase family protein [Spirosoma rhododendri]
MNKLLTIVTLLIVHTLGVAQTTTGWNGKKCAVVLTYDDALDVHLTNVVPLLDSLGLKGTFYLSGYFPGYVSNIDRWRAAARKGHELGNHTLFHPCLGNQPGREWVNPNKDMSKYTVQRMTDEIGMMNVLLQTIDGKTERTFAYPCGDTKIGGVDYYKPIESKFVAARGVRSEMKPIGQLNYADIGSYSIVDQTGEQLIELVRQAQASNSLLVFLFHGVGGGHSLNVALPEHNKLIRYLKQHEADVWVAPFIDAVKYAKTHSPTTR